MYPQSFEYITPRTLKDAVKFLKEHEDESKILAGGQSLIPILKMRFASFGYIVDIGGLQDLSYIKRDGDNIRIGALVRTGEVEDSQEIRMNNILLAEAASQVADSQVRNMGTIGGNCVHGDPGNDLPSVMLALDATYRITGPDGSRDVGASSFYKDSYSTDLRETEILTEIVVPVIQHGSGGAYVKHKRRAGDFSIAAVAAFVTINELGNCGTARIAVTSIGPINFRSKKAEDFLVGKKLSDQNISKAVDLMVDSVEPAADPYGSTTFKKEILRLVGVEALSKATDRALGV